ncbi:hypothetical protein Q3G72_001289 [Acer saccharum]|nr:hypothetical protein Q3G72_001289 [Acer saccharum]
MGQWMPTNQHNVDPHVEKCKSKEDAEECLKKLSDEERDKLGVERLADISNVIYTSTPSNEDIAKRTDMLVTILVAAKGKAVDSFPPCIDCRDSIRKAYKKTLIEIASSKTVELQALDVLWVDTPCGEELHKEYPHLGQLEEYYIC